MYSTIAYLPLLLAFIFHGDASPFTTQQVPTKHILTPGQFGAAPPVVGNATFSQYIDHSNPGLGTFEQFYYWSDEFYAGPGSPVVLFTPGEVNVTGYTSYLSTNRTTGVIAKEIGAAVIALEHRYWGFSSPYPDLTTDNLRYLTLENAITDLTRFAREVQLPFDVDGSSNAANAPWVLMGASYSGALAA